MNLKTKIKAIEKIYQKLSKKLESCALCPRNCQINRLNNELGYCGQGKKIKIYSSFLHFGEEPPISGKRGSGTIFFSGCSLGCVYCQNYKFSQLNNGRMIEEHELVKIMLNLEKKEAQNLNLVTPTHFLPQILKALKTALEKGLRLPIVYNSSGYEKKEIVETIEPIIDSWLIDFKYINSETAKNYSNSPQYPRFAKNTLSYLYKQKKGQNRLNRGQIPPIIIRHLILPGHIDETKKILVWIKKNTPEARISIMSQYQPYFKAKKIAHINRPLNLKEYTQIKELVERLELKGWLQEYKPQENLAGVHFKKQNYT
ncbi:MAG: radical SAM protein [Candidatus Omnitrophica bacterium]|nr:radical SAM protein [Candidatus Omnitrophota bacterium]MCF7876828.1 radical SAM protein [Candidatus Omnitrophota bacterium]MCF7878122.1 radical SAM protein [Candidatus Omnitrophota bacterium]MCF7892973.1 radical SAM protein [Candidatus Omnitrophota bacterium]